MTGPAQAARYTATSATLESIFATARAGDTIALSGRFERQMLRDRSFTRPLLIDASAAQFDAVLDIRNVSGLTFRGGTFGSATAGWQNAGTVRVEDSRNIAFRSLTMIAPGQGAERGITFRDSSDVRLSGSSFTGFRLAAGFTGIQNGLIDSNRVTGSTSDGFIITNSHFVTASKNSCAGTVPSPEAHADCIQLWSHAGQPVQSDIRILNNKATGRTQGFTSFDAARGGGLRYEFANNFVSVSYPNGIACHACVDSRFTGNTIRTEPGSTYQTRLSIVGGANNFVADNDIGPGPKQWATGDAVASRAFTADVAPLVAGVPEPMVWAQLVLGLGLTGAVLRRRQARVSR